VNPGLLTCSKTDDGTVDRVADGVGLSVFQGDGGDDQVGNGGWWELEARQ